MTTRIDARFAELAKEGRSAFVTFLIAGDPDPKTSLDIVKALPKAGADIIELGMPFTDPMADGPSIQAAGLRALKAGMTLTIEPGLYVRAADDVPPEYWNIGIRIEDDAIVREHGCELITRGVPVAADEIEALMRAGA